MAGLPAAVLFACSENSIRSPMAEALLKHLLGHRSDHVGIDIAGCDGVHANTEISSLERERAGECLNSCLGAVVGDHVGLRLAGPCKVQLQMMSDIDICRASE